LLTTDAPTTALPETVTPTVPEDTAQGDNDQCTGAIILTLGETITGSTVGATLDDMMEEDCGTALGGADQSAPGVWYVVEGTGETMQVYTNATYDMQISVYEGADCDSLSCISGNGGFPPSYFVGFVTFPSVAGQTYYILINGFTGAVGNFELYAENYEPLANDECSGATEIAIGESISGSTLFAEIDEVNDYCSGWNVSQRGVWFTLTGNGQTLQAAITGNDFLTQMNVYSGSCGDLTCVLGRIASPSLVFSPIVWDSEEDQVYYLLVSGINQEVGSFNLLVNATMPSQNNNCEDAIEITVPGTQEGTTVGASLAKGVEYCGL
jgi:hypothetical protein